MRLDAEGRAHRVHLMTPSTLVMRRCAARWHGKLDSAVPACAACFQLCKGVRRSAVCVVSGCLGL